jgi:hypothetical protein
MTFVLHKTLMLSLLLYWRETCSATEERAKTEVFADEEYFDLTDRKYSDGEKNSRRGYS